MIDMVEKGKTNWSARIANATSPQLVIIIYELIFEAIDTAEQQLKDNDINNYRVTIERARKLLRELSYDLNLENTLEYDVLSLYLFVSKLFVESYFSKKIETLHSAKNILQKLYEGLKEAEKMLPKEEAPSIKNAQQVYAGLTYGKGMLNESVQHEKNRGFKA